MTKKSKTIFKKRQGIFKDGDKVPITLSSDILTSVLSYVLSDNPIITRGNLTNAKKLIDLMDIKVYENDVYAMAKIHYIKQILIGKIDLYINNKAMLLDYAESSKFKDVKDEILYDIENFKLSTSEVKYMSSMISDRLNYCFLYLYRDLVVEQFQRMDTNDFVHLKDLKNNIMDVLVKLIADIRRAENLEKANMDFSLEAGIMEAIVEKTVKDLQNPSCNLKTGIQSLNDMFGGALESDRFYLFLGVSGGFKSGILLNILYQIKMNNMGYKTKDPTKKPAVLLYTQENTVEETVNRLFSLAVSKDKDDRLKNYTPREAIRLLKEKGQLLVNDMNNINIIIKYAKTKTKTTQDLYYVIDDLEDQGYEVICLIHDYVKRLRSVTPSSELRLELGYIVDELKALAIEKHIPVISATQLNKESARIIDEGVQCNKSDLARLLGRANIGESWTMIENSDFVILINREVQKSTGTRYLTFKKLKGRGEESDMEYFNQPFDGNNTMRLVQDVGCTERSSISSLASDLVPDFAAIKEAKMERANAVEREKTVKDKEENVVFNLDSYFNIA